MPLFAVLGIIAVAGYFGTSMVHGVKKTATAVKHTVAKPFHHKKQASPVSTSKPVK